MRSLERFVYSTDFTSGDLFWVMRNYQSLWSRVLGTPVTLCFKDGQIDFEASPLSPSYSRISSLKDQLRVARIVEEGEKMLSLSAVYKLDWLLDKLSVKEREALYWRLIDRSCTKVNNIRKPPSSREIAAMLSIPYSTFRDRMISGWEKLGFSWEELQDYMNEYVREY
ncbi:hypothetical protein [Mesotoga sp.]|uniref:hypothetical protein n=1 Tax=Mesotoga sp. TaxID=2053577 RepID=UPI00345F0101